MSSWLRQPPHQHRADVALALQLAQKPALFDVAERSVPSRIAEALAHVGRAGRAGVVLIDFSNDRRGARNLERSAPTLSRSHWRERRWPGGRQWLSAAGGV